LLIASPFVAIVMSVSFFAHLHSVNAGARMRLGLHRPLPEGRRWLRKGFAGRPEFGRGSLPARR
jgi:hypothetical protein